MRHLLYDIAKTTCVYIGRVSLDYLDGRTQDKPCNFKLFSLTNPGDDLDERTQDKLCHFKLFSLTNPGVDLDERTPTNPAILNYFH